MFNLTFRTALIIFAISGGCHLSQERDQPSPPKKVQGWKDSYFGGVHSIAELYLHKNESSNIDTIGVRVLDIIAAEPGAEGYAGTPKVKLQFYRPSDKTVLCEATFTEGGTVIGEGPPYPYCKPEVGLSA